MADVDGGEVVDNPAAHRFELTIDGETAELVYRLKPPVLELVHTGVPDALEGEGLGGRLVRAALEVAERGGLTIVPTCPFARDWLRRHPAEAARVSIAYPD
jgi:predicted GNAT family acetyltransferase